MLRRYVMTDLDTRLFDGYAAFQAAVRELLSDASQAAADVTQRYSAELFAANGGDDAVSRQSKAWSSYQQDMAKLSYEYWRGLREQQRELAATIGEVRSDAAARAYEQYLEAVKIPDSARPTTSTQPRKTTASGVRRTPRRSPETPG
jgi:hypothetical protein